MKNAKVSLTIKARSANELIGDLEWCAKNAFGISNELKQFHDEEAWASAGNIKDLGNRMKNYAKQVRKQVK